LEDSTVENAGFSDFIILIDIDEKNIFILSGGRNMYFQDSVIESIASPAFLVGLDGKILRINRHAYTLLERTLQVHQLHNIQEIDPDFSPVTNEEMQKRTLEIGKLKLSVHIYPCINDNSTEMKTNVGFLYIIDNFLFNTDFVRLMNVYEDLITIANRDGIIEFVNNASFTQTGERYGVGTDTHEMQNAQILNEPITLTVLRTRKPAASRLFYRSGAVLLNRAWPLFQDNGEIEKIAILAQNIPNVSEIDERLFIQERFRESPQLETDEMIVKLKERNIIVSSSAMQQVFMMAYKVAISEAAVFIQGETGVGKEIVAKFIHQNSGRRQGPFISVNCSSIPKDLFESEFFGYEKGAFTGASKNGKPGLFELQMAELYF